MGNLPLDELRIQDLYDELQDRWFTASDYLGASDFSFYGFRWDIEDDIQEGKSRIVCAVCRKPVVLRDGFIKKDGTNVQRYFRHLNDKDSDCPIKTPTKFSKGELQARMYNGATESPKHIEMKNRICEVIELDKRFGKPPVQEERISDPENKRGYRRPDVKADYQGTPFAFEMQISNTFLTEMVARDRFYRKIKMPLIWVCDGFFNDYPDLRTFHKDIYYHYGQKLIVFDDDAYNYSTKESRLTFTLYSIEQCGSRADRKYSWQRQFVDFDVIAKDTSFDRDIDYDKHIANNIIFDIIRSGEQTRDFKDKLYKFTHFDFTDWNDMDFECLHQLFIVFLSMKEGCLYGTTVPNYRAMSNILYIGNRSKDKHIEPHLWLFYTFVESDNHFKTLVLGRTYRQRKQEAETYQRSNKFVDILRHFFGNRWTV